MTMPAHDGGPKPRTLPDDALVCVQLRCNETLGHIPSRAGGFNWRWDAKYPFRDIIAWEAA